MKKNRSFKDEEEYFRGTEPVFVENEPVPNPTDIYNWYSAMWNTKQAVSYLKNRLKALGRKDVLEDIKNVPDWKIPTTICHSFRMEERGFGNIIDKNYREKAISNMRYSCRKWTEENKPEIENSSPKISLKDSRISEVCAEIDEKLDNIDSDNSFEPFSFYREMELKSPDAKIIAERYSPILEEYQLSLHKKNAEIFESYNYLTKNKKMNRVNFLKNVISDAEKISEMASSLRKPRKTRKPKAIQPDKLVKSFKYKVSDDILKIASQSPEKIIGASCVVLFNTKDRRVFVLNAEKGQTLSVKATTITGFSESDSLVKKVRKPELTLESLKKTTKMRAKKVVESLTTNPLSVSGRCNTDTIILSVYK